MAGGGSTPKQPDYKGAAEATAQGNIQQAREAAQANRVNQITPYGSLTWSNDRTFDQAGYDAAMRAYQQALQSQGGQSSNPGRQTGFVNAYTGSGDNDHAFSVPVYANGQIGGSSGNRGTTGSMAAPNMADFWSNGDQWTQTVNFSPEMQAQFDQQNKIAQGLFGAQDAALGRVNSTMGSAFDTSNLPAWGQALNQSSLPGMGQVLDPSKLPGMGQALNGANMRNEAINLNNLPGGGQVMNMSNLPGMGSVLDPGGLASQGQVYDPRVATNNAADQILQRVNPELDRQSQALQSQLAAQGITPGSRAYNNAMTQMQQGRNDAYSQAALQGIGLGMQQQGLQFNQQQALRDQDIGIQNAQYAQQQGLRMGEASLQNQQYNQANQNRSLEAALQSQRLQQLMGIQGQEFNQQNALRQQEAALQNQQFGQANQNQSLAAALQNQQFNQANQARQNQFQEQAYLRNLPMQELAALTQGSNVSMPQFPGYAQQHTTGGPDYLGAANSQYQTALGAANAANANQSNMMGGLFGLAGTGLGGIFGGAAGAGIGGQLGGALGGLFSDRRLKKDIKRVGTAGNGLGIYSYQYIWGGPQQLGYMADEVERVAPDAVSSIGGLKLVDYSKV